MESRLNPREARAALDAVAESRSDIADRLCTPWWYHPILGVLCGGLIAVAGSGTPLPVLLGAIAVFGLGVLMLVTVYRRIAGVWVHDHAAGPRARRSALAAAVVGIVIAAAGAAFGLGFDLWWPPIAAGALIAVLTVVWGRHFDTLLRAYLRESA